MRWWRSWTPIERQVALARRYGIGEFCVYCYNFGAHRTLDQAFEAIVANPAVDFPYCVCRANENWTRYWDGGSREIILQQQYDNATSCRIIQDAIRYASDARYLRVNGKSLFLVCRPLLLHGVADSRGSTWSLHDSGFSAIRC
jgi:Glycosyltransferase WbsX